MRGKRKTQLFHAISKVDNKVAFWCEAGAFRAWKIYTYLPHKKKRFMCLIHILLFAKYDSSLPWQLSNINGEVLMPSIASIRVMMMKKKAEGKTSQVPLGWKFLRFGSSESEKKFNLFNNLCCNTKLEERFWAELSHYSQNKSWLAGGFPVSLTELTFYLILW